LQDKRRRGVTLKSGSARTHPMPDRQLSWIMGALNALEPPPEGPGPF
jgi:hypothetical protein